MSKRSTFPLLAVRIKGDNPDHHLWNNHGTWFVHYTIYPDPLTARRIRRSLRTRRLAEARRLRDRLFTDLSRAAQTPMKPKGVCHGQDR